MSLPYWLRGALFRHHRCSCSANLQTPFLMVRTTTRKVVMNMVEGAATASDRETYASRAWVEWLFGHGARETLAHRFLAAGEAASLWNTCGKERRVGRKIPRPKRTYRELSCWDRRRGLGISSAPFSSLGDAEKERKGKQDKGSVSRHCVSDCLHILFSRDSRLQLRDCRKRNGGNLPFPARNREILGHFDA